MTENIYGYSQAVALELKLDFNDIRILYHFQAYIDTGKMTTETHQGKTYYWLLYDKMLNDLPLLNIKKRQLANRFNHMVKQGVLEFYQKRKAGNYTFYRLTDFYYNNLVFHTSTEEHSYVNEIAQGTSVDERTLCKDSDIPYVNQIANKDKGLKDKGLKNKGLKDKKDTPPKKTDLDFSTFLQNNIFSTNLLNPTNEFIEHRNDMKKPLTYKGLERLVKKINGLKGMYSEAEIIAIIDKSIVNNWLDIYPPHESDRAKEQARLKEKEKVKTNYDWCEY